MQPTITALVLGVGKFGKHYAVILSELNGRELPGVPQIEKLIVTRTQKKRAEDVAQHLRQNINCTLNEIIGVEVSRSEHLHQLLKVHRPHFTAITAKDKVLGDTVHAHYAAEALRYGAVLCEKPFCNAYGDGLSLQYFNELKNLKYAGLFGLELPLAVVSREMMKHADLRKRLLNAAHLEFHWEARDRGDDNVIDDLALHPWSLIPPQFKTRLVDVRDRGNQADISVSLYNSQSRQLVTCCILLRSGDNFRGMMIDDFGVGIISEGSLIKVVRLDRSLKGAVLHQNESLRGDVLLQVNNPLEQHIVAALHQRPIVGISRAYESQLFLEELHGYKLNQPGWRKNDGCIIRKDRRNHGF
jgi:hypothetical protein